MKKISFVFAAIATVVIAACQQEIDAPENVQDNFVSVEFGAEVSETITKALLEPTDASETSFNAEWTTEDAIFVEYVSPNGQTNTVSASWTGSSFSADNFPNETGEWLYEACYPVPDANDSHVDFGGTRVQKGSAYNSRYDIMIGMAGATQAAAGKNDDGSAILFPMERQTAIVYFHFTSSLYETVTSATLTVTGDNAFIASQYAYVSDFSWAPNPDTKAITITFPEEAPSASDFKLWFNVLETKYESMSLTVTTKTNNFTINRSGSGSYEAGKLYKVSTSIPDNAWDSEPVVERGTVLWSENWGHNDPAPTTTTASMNLSDYNYSGTSSLNGSVAYSIPDGASENTKIYIEASNSATWTVLGEPNELVLAKTNGKLFVDNIPTGNASSATLSMIVKDKTGTACALSSTTEGVTISNITYSGAEKPFGATATLSFDTGVKTFNLCFANTTGSPNRIDNISLIVGAKPIIKPQYSNINFNAGVLSRTFTFSIDNVENGTLTFSSTDSWISAQMVDATHFSVTLSELASAERTGSLVLSSPDADDVTLTITQKSSLIDNPTVSVVVNDDKDGFVASWDKVANASGYDCFYAQTASAETGTAITPVEGDNQFTATVTGLEEGTYYLYVRSQANENYLSPSNYAVKTVVLSGESSDPDPEPTDPVVLASWTFESGTAGTNYPSNKTNFAATGGSCTESTFYFNGTGSTWNTSKGWAFTAITSLTVTLKTNVAISSGSKITLSMDAFYNKASNAPVTGFTIKVSENNSSASTTGLSPNSWALSTSSANKSVEYTVQNDLASGSSIAFTFTQTGKAGAGQAFINNVTIVK